MKGLHKAMEKDKKNIEVINKLNEVDHRGTMSYSEEYSKEGKEDGVILSRLVPKNFMYSENADVRSKANRGYKYLVHHDSSYTGTTKMKYFRSLKPARRYALMLINKVDR